MPASIGVADHRASDAVRSSSNWRDVKEFTLAERRKREIQRLDGSDRAEDTMQINATFAGATFHLGQDTPPRRRAHGEFERSGDPAGPIAATP